MVSGLHVYSVYGHSSDDPLMPEKKEQGFVLLAGYWNFEPDDMPADLVHGGQVVRPLSDHCAKAWQAEMQSSLTGSSPPNCWRQLVGLRKPLILNQIIKSMKSLNLLTREKLVEAAYMAERANHVGAWILAMQEQDAVNVFATFLKCVGATAPWPPELREMPYLQLPKEGANNAGERRLIALLPQVYRLWSACCRADTPVGQGALDETFDLAYLTEERSAAGKHQAGVFLDCSKCYERVPLRMLVEFAIESGYPLHAVNVVLNMYSGTRRILVQGAVSEGVTATCGLPPGSGHPVDLLHAFLIRSLRCAERQVEVRKYVDDMALISSGPNVVGNLCFAYRQVLKSLTEVNMRANAGKTVMLCNGSVAKRKLLQVWRHGRLPPVQITTRDLGVDTQWFAWRNPVQQKRISSFRVSMSWTRALGLPAHVKARIVKSLFSVGLCMAQKLVECLTNT
eukprot:4911967-Amphidinium_carterae.2